MANNSIYAAFERMWQHITTALATKSDTSHNHNDIYDAKGSAGAALESAKAYTDDVKNDLLNGAGTAYDTLKELGDLIDENTDAIDALTEIASGKADASHTHTIADVTDLQNALDGKADASHTHTVSQISDLTATATELNYMDGVTSNVQTQLNTKVDAVSGKGLSTNDYTTEDKEKLDAIPTAVQESELVEFTAYTENDIQTLWDSVVV